MILGFVAENQTRAFIVRGPTKSTSKDPGPIQKYANGICVV